METRGYQLIKYIKKLRFARGETGGRGEFTSSRRRIGVNIFAGGDPLDFEKPIL